MTRRKPSLFERAAEVLAANQSAVLNVPDRDPTPLEVQIGGLHYKALAIQPVEYIHANGIGFCEGSAIKYLTRWRSKGGIEDLRKAKHFIEMLIDLEEKNTQSDTLAANIALDQAAREGKLL